VGRLPIIALFEWVSSNLSDIIRRRLMEILIIDLTR